MDDARKLISKSTSFTKTNKYQSAKTVGAKLQKKTSNGKLHQTKVSKKAACRVSDFWTKV
jgi:hypothetical protein